MSYFSELGARRQPQVDLVYTPQSVGLYVDGELLEQGALPTERILELLGIHFRSHVIQSSNNPSVNTGILPIKFDRVVLEGISYDPADPRAN